MGFPILDLLLGLIFIFFVLSIVTSAVVEVITTKLNFRSKVLTQWLLNIFDKSMLQADGTSVVLGRALANHCMTTALSREGSATSFIDAKNFVSAMIEKVTFRSDTPDAPAAKNLDELLRLLDDAKALDGTSLLSTELRRTVQLFGSEARMLAPDIVITQSGSGTNPQPPNSFQIFREKLEAWFDSSMDRVTGRMKRRYVRPLTFWIGVLVVVVLNADAIALSRYLYNHDEAAAAFAAAVPDAAKAIANDTAGQGQRAFALLQKISPSELPLGWAKAHAASIPSEESPSQTILTHLPGWIVSVMAIMLGAPFWFDLINRIANVRGVGSKPASTTDPKNLSGKAV